jgi:hypothetical protein
MGAPVIWFLISGQCINISAGQRRLREGSDSVAGRRGCQAELGKNGSLNRHETLVGIPPRVTGTKRSFQKKKRDRIGETLRRDLIDAGRFCPPRMISLIGIKYSENETKNISMGQISNIIRFHG